MMGPVRKDPGSTELDVDEARHPIRRGLQASARKSYQRHAEPDWPEWAAREFLRVCYIVLFFAVIVLGALQIEYSLLPQNAPPVLDPTLVTVVAIVFVVAALIAAGYGYYYLWRSEGYVDRWAEKRRLAADADPHRRGEG